MLKNTLSFILFYLSYRGERMGISIKIWHGVNVTETWSPTIDYSKCTNCTICLLACGNKVFSWSNSQNKVVVQVPTNCVLGCTSCLKLCPSEAIYFPEEPKKFIRKLIVKYKIYTKIKNELMERLKKYPDRNLKIETAKSVENPNVEFSNWHGMERKKISWYPTIDTNKCVGCGLCVVTCGEKRNVFGYDVSNKKAFVLYPYNCMVGCNNCSVSCMWNAISFQEYSVVKEASKKVIKENSEILKKEVKEKVKQQNLATA